MNTIEQAAKRLEQLRRAGITLEGESEANALTPPPAASPPAHRASPSATSQAAEASASGASSNGQPKVTPEATATPDLIWTEEHPDGIRIVLGDISAPDAAQGASDHAPSAHHGGTVELNFPNMLRHGLLVPGQPRSQLEEEIRIIKRPLLENARADATIKSPRANLIMVTSALPGEGKTQTALNLAISMATELDHTVLLVEADVLQPSALERLGVNTGRGLLDLLQTPSLDLSDVLLRTNIPKLKLLSAGQGTNRSTELLASQSMDKMLEELSKRYSDRIIIFDTPPLLPTTESRVLASRMGQVVLVVEAGRTPSSTVKQAIGMLQEHPIVLCMLNKYRGPKNNKAYGYYAP